MRKVSVASQDGGDSMSITSGVDNEIRKSGGGILKTKKTSIKRKVQNFSLESDDGVVEPLLQKEKEKETGSQSAKFSLSKSKTDSMTDKGGERDKLLDDNKTSVPSMTSVPGITNNRTYVNGIKDSQITKSYASAAPIHNHMNTNVFASRNEVSSFTAPKTQILVDIDGNKQKSHCPSPLIFTTAKIHTDGKTKTFETVDVTPQPILSTVEGNIVKIKASTDEQRLKNDHKSAKKDYHSSFEAIDSKSDASHPSAPNEVSLNTVATVSVSFYSGILNKGPTVTSARTICTPFVPTELKTFKYIPSEGKLKDITASKVATVKTKDNTEIKEIDVSALLPQTNHSAKSEVTKTSSTVKDLQSPSSTTIKTGETNSLNHFKLQNASTPTVVSEVEIDINKNVQSVNVSTPRKQETSISPSIVGEITKESCNKQLQRQKNSNVGEDKMSDKNTRKIHKNPNDSNLEVVGSSKEVTSPKIGAYNIKDSSTITTESSTITKRFIENSVSDTKASTFVPEPTVLKQTNTNNCPESSNLKSGVIKSSIKITSPIVSTAEDKKALNSTHSKIPTSSATVLANAKTASSFTQPVSSLIGTSNISMNTMSGATKSKEVSQNMTNFSKTPANNSTNMPNTNQATSNSPQNTSLTSNKSMTTVSHIPLTTSSSSTIKQTTTPATTSLLLSSNKPLPTTTTEVFKTLTKSSDMPSLSQSTKTLPLVSSAVNSTTDLKTSTPLGTVTTASKPSTVTTMKMSTSKVSNTPKTTTQAVTPTTESTLSTVKPPEYSKVTTGLSKNDKSKA